MDLLWGECEWEGKEVDTRRDTQGDGRGVAGGTE